MVSQIKIKRKVNEFVECAAASYIKGFYPTAAAKYAETSVEEVFKYLVDLTKTGELELKWELRCPDFTCGKIIDVSIDRNEALNDTILCPKCGKEFDVNIRDFYPVFMITNQFKEIIREERSKKKSVPSLTLKELRGTPYALTEKILSTLETRERIEAIKERSPIVIVNYIEQYIEGNGEMDKRQIISSFNKSTISENVNIQGDDVKQHKEINYNNIVDDAFTKLFEEIQKIYDDAKRKEAEFFAQQLQEAYNKKDKEKAKTLIEFLRQRVQDVAALMTIATTLGITF